MTFSILALTLFAHVLEPTADKTHFVKLDSGKTIIPIQIRQDGVAAVFARQLNSDFWISLSTQTASTKQLDSSTGDSGLEVAALAVTSGDTLSITVQPFPSVNPLSAAEISLYFIPLDGDHHFRLAHALSTATYAGEAYFNGDFNASVRLFDNSMRELDALGYPKLAANFQYVIAVIHDQLVDRANSLRAIRDAIERAKASGDRHLLAKSLNLQGMFLRQKGDHYGALDSLTQSIELFDKFLSQEPLLDINARIEICNVLREQGQSALSIPCYEELITRLTDASDHFRTTVLLGNLANSYEDTGNYSLALAMRDRALTAVEEISTGHPEYDIRKYLIQRQRGRLLFRMGAFHAGILDHLTPLEFFLETGELYYAAHTLLSLSTAYLEMGQPTIAEFLAAWAHRVGNDIPDEKILFLSDVMLARTYLALGRYDLAKRHFDSASERAMKAQNPQWLVQAIISQPIDRVDKDALKQSIALARKLEFSQVELNAKLMLAKLELRDRNCESIREIAYELTDFQYSEPRTQVETLFVLAQCEYMEGRLIKAMEYMRSADSRIQKLWKGVRTAGFQGSFLGTFRRFYDFYIELLVQHARSGSPTSIGTLLSMVNEQRFRVSRLTTNKGTTTVEEMNLATELGILTQTFLNGSAHDASILQRYLRRLIQLEARAVRPLGNEGLNDLQGAPTDIKEVAQIQYVIGGNLSFAIMSWRGRHEIHPLPSSELLSELVDRFLASIETKSVTSFALARSLSATIFPDSLTSIDTEKLVIIPDGRLTTLPFAALPIGKGKSWRSSELFIHRFDFALVPSTHWVNATVSGKRLFGSALAVSDPVFERHDDRFSPPTKEANPNLQDPIKRPKDRLIRLPSTRREVEALRSFIGSESLISMSNFHASRAQFIAYLSARSFDIIHIATHAVSSDAFPKASGIYLSQFDPAGRAVNGFLSLFDINNLKISTELVVLSACQTGLGPELYREGIDGIARAFLAAGSRQVMYTLWRVPSRSTSALVEAFYRNLNTDHHDTRGALRKAQLEIMGRRGHNSPYYWAGFNILGRVFTDTLSTNSEGG